MAKKGARVLGPYANGANFRLIIIDGDKDRDSARNTTRRKSVTAKTREQALALKASLEGELSTVGGPGGRTIGEALTEYVEECILNRGISPTTVADLRRLTARFLPADALLGSITPEDATRLYLALAQRTGPRGAPLSPNTHHVMLRRARTFFGWAAQRYELAQNPFSEIKPVGVSRAGKPQLTIAEARQFKAVALAQAEQGDAAALGVLLLLLLGLRAGEVLGREARDIDDDARVLWVTRGKTQNARRRLEVPVEVQEPLRRLIAGRAAHELVFGKNRKGGIRNKAYLWFKVQSLCDAAGVPRVCAHSLRGLHSTLALEAGATPQLVAAALGHSSFRVTARHYADPNTLLNTRTRRVSGALGATSMGQKVAAKEQGDLAELIAGLTPEQRDHLRSMLNKAGPC